MKKLVCIILAILYIGLLTSCGGEKSKENTMEMTYDNILKINRRQVLAEKYGTVTEYTHNKNTRNGDVLWALRYDYADGKFNTIVDMGDNYRCYYYNGDIMAQYTNRFSYIVNFRKDYNETLMETLKRDTILNYNFYQTDSYIETESGYVIKYSCKAGPEIADEFSDWDVKVNDEIFITFNLAKNGEIQDYSYFINIDGKKTEIVNVTFKYGEKIEFPEQITNKNSKKHRVTIYENYGSANPYKETYNIPDGFTIDVNSNLYIYDAFKDTAKNHVWNFARDKVTADTNLYLDKDSDGLSYEEYEFMEDDNDE
mgnify:CR=1 FL=1